MARSVLSTRPRRVSLAGQYLSEPVLYGGEVWTRGEVIRDLKRKGVPDRSIDRYLQGADLRQRLEEQRRLVEPFTASVQ